MKKEDSSRFFNSQDGKVNLSLLVSIVFVFVFVIIASLSVVIESLPVNAMINITPVSPTDLSINGSKKINFTFYVNMNSTGNDVIANCSIWTNITGTWKRDITNSSTGNSSNITNSTSELSWMNITFGATARDGNFSWAVECTNVTASGTSGLEYNASNFSINRTLYIDSVAPRFILDTPKGNLTFGTNLNITSNSTAVFYINVSDNSTHSVWYILNNLPTIVPAGSTNESLNRTMTLDRTIRGDLRMYNVSIALLLNFTSNFTGPGPHSVVFCANDTTGRRNCSAPVDFIVRGMSCGSLERSFGGGEVSHPEMGHIFLGMDIRYGNGTDFPADDFLDPVNINLSFVVNFTADQGIIIVGAKIDTERLSNSSSTNYSSEISREVKSAAGSGLRSNLTWTDVKHFIPSEVSYEFGIVTFRNTFSKMMFCNGTSIANPGCFNVGQCNSSNFNIYNHTKVIPANSACWLTNGSWGVENGSESNLPSIPRGFTYLFVDHFSGGLGASDFGAPEIQFFGNLVNGQPTSRKETPPDDVAIFNTTTNSVVINFTVTDLNSTGINMTTNGTINVSIKTLGTIQGTSGERVYYSGKNLTCTPIGLLGNTSIANITGSDTNGNLSGINCTVTVSGLRNGTHNITVQAVDTGNNSNINITSIRVTIDQIPPVFVYYNFTNSSVVNASGGSYNTSFGLGLGDELSRAQGDANTGRIFAIANWTDNFTQVFGGHLQFYNESRGTGEDGWQILNSSFRTNSSWTNFTFPIPRGHNNFEGRNISFRIIANDTLGNINRSVGVTNFTIQINDTTIPRVVINGTIAANGSNLSITSVSVVSWVVDDNSRLTEINVSVDSITDTSNCNKFKRFTTSPGADNVESRRNSSFATHDTDIDPNCALNNGTHNVSVGVRDTWGNSIIVFHVFTVQTGSVPGLRFNSVRSSVRTPTNISAVNNTNITSSYGLNFSSVTGGVDVANFTYISSCNESATIVRLQEAGSNSTVIYPFNESTCPTTSGNRTITLTVTDTAGNSNTTVFGFTVDNAAPTIAVHFPTAGASINGKVDINVSALDTESQVDTIGYYLDGVDILRNHTIRNRNIVINGTIINGTRLSDLGSNTSIINITINVTSGTHTIKISVNDTLGNMRNSSVITFTVLGPLDFGSMRFNATNGSSLLSDYNTNISFTNLTNASGQPIEDIRSVTDQTLNLFMSLNATKKGINVTISFNASAANWNRYNFSVIQNETRSFNGITVNWTATIVDFLFINNSIQDFISDNNSYYGVIDYPINISNSSIGGIFKLLYFSDIRDYTTGINITECSSGFTPTPQTALSAGTFPCWNNSNSSRSVRIFVPHFSIIAAVNDSDAPTLNVTTPNLDGGNATLSMFVPNITTSQDAVSCKYSINGTVTNVTMAKSGTVCLGQTQRFANTNTSNLTGIAGGAAYNITFYVTDSAGNVNTYLLKFNVTDKVEPNSPNGTTVSTSVSTTTATVTISGINETVNATVYYGTSIDGLSSSAVQTDFNETQAVSLTGLSASTLYHFNVTVCDFNGNCARNGTFNLTTSTAASDTTTTTTPSSSSGGGGVAAPSNVEASAARKWDKLDAGESAVLTINNEKIAVTGVVIDVKNAVTNAEVTVESLTSNPLSTSASSKTYQYLQLKKGNIADSDASKITINFKVPKSWLSSNNVAEGDVVLYRYSESKWNALPTTKSGADANNVMYQSTTPGFSIFTIGSKEAVPVVTQTPTEEKPAGQVPVPTGEVITPVSGEKPAPEAMMEKKPISDTIKALIAVAIIVIIAGIGYFMWQKKKGQ